MMNEPIICHPLLQRMPAKYAFLRFIKDPDIQRMDEFSRIDLAALKIGRPGCSIHRMLFWFCYRERDDLELLRMLVENTQNAEIVREAFMFYADEGELNQVTALFLAAPELFLSSQSDGLSTISKLHLKLSSLESKTDTEEELSLLLDVFLMVGEKLVAYVRLDDISELLNYKRTQLDIAFLLREVVHKKLGVFSLDYYVRYFKESLPDDDSSYDTDYDYDRDAYDEDDNVVLTWENVMGVAELGDETYMFTYLPWVMKMKNIDKLYFYSVLPNLEPVDADCLNRAIEKKLSSMSTFHNCMESMTKKLYEGPREGVNPLPQIRCGGNYELGVRPFHSSAASAKPNIDLKIIPRNVWGKRVVKPNKYFFSAMDLSYFLTIVKRKIK